MIALDVVTCCNLDAYLVKFLLLSCRFESWERVMTLISKPCDVLDHHRVNYPIVTCDLIFSVFEQVNGITIIMNATSNKLKTFSQGIIFSDIILIHSYSNCDFSGCCSLSS